MAYEPKNGDISVFKNKRKTEDKPNYPDYEITGLDLNGDKIKGALWLKTDRNGNKYMSGKIEADTYQREERSDADDFRGAGSGDVAGNDRHGRGQDAGRRAAYEPHPTLDDSPF